MQGICCRGLFRYLHKTLTWFITLTLTYEGNSGFCSKSLFWAGCSEELSCFSICTRNTYGRLWCHVHLGVTCSLDGKLIPSTLSSLCLGHCHPEFLLRVQQPFFPLPGRHNCITTQKRNKEIDWKSWDQFGFFSVPLKFIFVCCFCFCAF